MIEKSLLRKIIARPLIGGTVFTGFIEATPVKDEFAHASLFSVPVESPGGAAILFAGSALVCAGLTLAGHYLPKFWKLYNEDIPEYWNQ